MYKHIHLHLALQNNRAIRKSNSGLEINKESGKYYEVFAIC